MHQSVKFLSVVLFYTLMVSDIFGQGHKISIQLDHIDQESIIVGYHFGKQRLVLDTLTVKPNNTVEIAGTDTLASGVYFLYGQNLYFEFLVHEQIFQLKLDAKDPYNSVEVTNSRENTLFKDFQVEMGRFQRQIRSLADSLSKISGEDSIAVREEYQRMVAEMSDMRSSMVKINKGTFFSNFLALMVGSDVPGMDSIEDDGDRKVAQFDYYRQHYMDLVTDPQLLMRTPVIHEYVMKYFSDLVIPQADSVIAEVDSFLQKTQDQPEAFRYWLVTLFNHFQESNIMGMDAVTVHLAEKYYLTGKADWVTDESRQDILKELRFIKPNLIGQTAPDMVLVDTALGPLLVQKISAPYLVLYFYDPDCGHCRKKTPILKEAYEELQLEGADVLAVCTITDIAKWKSYVNKNELPWYNGADPYGKSNFRVDYNVRSTPQIYVLDQSRNIIAKKIDVSQILGFIKNHKLMNTP